MAYTVIIAILIIIVAVVSILLIKEIHGKRAAIRYITQIMEETFDSDIAVNDNSFKALDRGNADIILKLSERYQASANLELLKTESELHALQNQINPHFLYNSLEVIRGRALREGNRDVAEMAEALSLQFRYCINNSGDMATLQQELDHVANYLTIQHYRFGDRFRYEEDIEETNGSVRKAVIPVLTLQPIVENSLIHGINKKIDGGKILISARVSGNRLYITVEDDGVGMSDEDLNRMRRKIRGEDTSGPEKTTKSNGIAIENVHKRIRFYFGENYGLDVSSTLGVGTEVIIKLPYIMD